MKPREKYLMIFMSVMVIGMGLAVIFLIPPFMNPDEIQHFMYTVDYAYDQKQVQQVDKELLVLLKEYRWFHYVGIGPGWEKVSRIEDIYFLNYFTRAGIAVNKTYFHRLYGKILKLSGIRHTLKAFYFLRFVSFLFYIAVFLLSFYFYRAYFPGQWFYLIAGQMLIFQFGTIMNSLNYDVLVIFLGVLFFILAYRFLLGGEKRDLLLLAMIAGLVSLVKTTGLLFFVYFFILLLFRYRMDVRIIKKIVFGLFVFVVVFSWMNYLFPQRFFVLYNALFYKWHEFFGTIGQGAGEMFNPAFFNSIFDSFFFYTGWMGFKLSGGWYLVLKVLLVVSQVGVLIGLFSRRLKAEAAGDGEETKNTGEAEAAIVAGRLSETKTGKGTAGMNRKWLIYIIMVTLVQWLALWLYYGSAIAAQGRYLYPIMLPIGMLIFYGFEYLHQALRLKNRYFADVYIIFLVFFCLFSLLRVITVYYLEIGSPHTGF